MGIVSRPGAGTCLRRVTFVNSDKSDQKRRQKLRFCTSSARYACSPLSAFPHVTGVFLIVVGPPTVPAQLSAAAARYYGKNYSFCRVAGYYIPCPTGTPTFAALRRQRRDLIIATRPAHQPLPSHRISGSGARGTSSPLNRQCYPPHFMRECIPPNLHDPQRAKGSLDRRSKRLSFPHFFLRRKKCGRRRLAPAGATPAHSRAKEVLKRSFKRLSLAAFFQR